MTRGHATNLGSPPLRIAKGTAGAPPGGFSYQLKKLRLKLSIAQVTQHVPFGTVADIYINFAIKHSLKYSI